jgi:Galactose oxidase, central domain/Kelch motif
MQNTLWKKEQDMGPSPRYSSAMVFADGRIILFGGFCSNRNGETWEWNGVRWIQRQNMGAYPRDSHSMTYDSDRKRVVLFGGLGKSGILGDTWELKIIP